MCFALSTAAKDDTAGWTLSFRDSARLATSKGRPFNAAYICCERGGRSVVQYQAALSFSEDAVAADRDGA
jgi:hypothetical protein